MEKGEVPEQSGRGFRATDVNTNGGGAINYKIYTGDRDLTKTTTLNYGTGEAVTTAATAWNVANIKQASKKQAFVS